MLRRRGLKTTDPGKTTMQPNNNVKWMTAGESGLAGLFTVTVFLSIFAAAKAEDAPFAFHAALAGVASLISVFAIFNRYYDRTTLPPQEIDGRPNYNLGPIKFASFMAMFWGIAGFTVG